VIPNHSSRSILLPWIISRVEAAQEVTGITPRFKLAAFNAFTLSALSAGSEVFDIDPGALGLKGAARVG
jgi:hypothetical protein